MHLTINTIAFMATMATALMSSSGLGTAPKDICPADFINLGASCYYFSDTLATYDEARALCREMATEQTGLSNLAVLGVDYEEYRYVGNHVMMNYGGPLWVGLSDVFAEGDWIWLDGVGLPKVSSMWDCDMPRDSDLYNCATLEMNYSTIVDRLLLTDQACSNSFGYICEYSQP